VTSRVLIIDSDGNCRTASPDLVDWLGISGTAAADLLNRLPDDVSVASFPLEDGAVAHVLTRSAELQRLHRDNAMLRETLDAIDGPVVVYTGELIYVFGNKAYHAFYPHLPPEAELVGKSYEHVLGLSVAAGTIPNPRAKTDPVAFVAERRAAMLDQRNTTEEVYNSKLGRWSSVRVQWTPSGNRVSLRVDITALKRLQQDLLSTQRMKTIGRISGGVAHNFNNLLTVISGNLEMLLDDATLPPMARRMATRSLSGAESGARLVRQLLTFAQRDTTQARPLDPNAHLTEMAELLRGAVGSSITVVFSLAPDVGQISVDPAQFSAALMNIMLNARDAVTEAVQTGTASKGLITIATSDRTTYPDHRHYVSIKVIDNGIGMSAEVAAEAFDPFFTTKGLAVASGLGLSQVHGFALGAGGAVQIETVPGEGTTIELRMPCVE
jgi:signal transduction histidine kinase